MTITKLLRIALAVTPLASGSAFAQEDRLRQVDALLDRLEKRLLDDEADGLVFGEKLPPLVDAGDEPAGSSFKPKAAAKIDARTSEQEQLKSLATLVTDLEAQVDQLAAGVQKTKQAILDEAGVDNFVAIEAELKDTDAAVLKTLTLKLDGFTVYELQETAGLWMPTRMVPLYAGPLQPGTHRLDLEARIALRTASALPMSGDVYRFVSKSFDLTVPGGTVNRRWLVTITPPQGEAAADATLKEAP